MITEPGIYTIPAAEYHADPCVEPSLSASIITKLCLESAAHAQYAHPRLNPAAVDENGDHFDVGTAAHALLLEGVKRIAVIEAKDYRTKVAQEARAAAYAAGQTPILIDKWTALETMVASVRAQLDRHTDGGAAMFTNGQPEQTLIWREDEVWCRARVDWLRPGNIDDFKTAESADPDRWTRTTMFTYGSDVQAAFYLRGLRALTGIDGVFRFAVIERQPPHVLSVIGLGPSAMTIGEKKVFYGLEKWDQCRRSGAWPGYSPTRTCWAELPASHESWWLERELR